MSESIIITPETIAMTANRAQGPLRKKTAPSIRVFYKHYAGGDAVIHFSQNLLLDTMSYSRTYDSYRLLTIPPSLTASVTAQPGSFMCAQS